MDYININNTLIINSADFMYNISESSIVSVVLNNEKNAWRKYKLIIQIDPYLRTSFGFINDIYIYNNVVAEFMVNIISNHFDLNVVDWSTNLIVSWVKYIDKNSTLQINPSVANVKSQCAKLASYDSWNNKIYSNKFAIIIKIRIAPPTIGNSFGPLDISVGKPKQFLVPNDLFISSQNFSLEYNVSIISCTLKTKLYVNITKSEKYNSYYLYALSYDAKSCEISITATDSDNQPAEIIVQVNAFNWASKDWVEWTSQYQADWVKWKDNYKLGSDEAWYRNISYFPNSINNLFDIWGLITMIWLLISTVLSFAIGLKSLYSIEFAHTIIIFVASSSNRNLIKLVSWVQIFKLDFGFLDILNIRDLLSCKIESDIMAEINFYCQSTLLNYFYLLLILIVISWWLIFLKIFANKLMIASKIYSAIRIKCKKENITWVLIHLFLSFLWINILSEALSISNHVVSSMVLFALLFILILLMLKYPFVFSLSFLKSVEQSNSSILTLLTILKSICHAMLFQFRAPGVRRILLIAEVLILFPYINISLTGKDETTLFGLYSTKMRGVKNSIFVAILIVLGIDDIVMMQITNQESIALMLAFFFSFWTIIDIGSVITKFAK